MTEQSDVFFNTLYNKYLDLSEKCMDKFEMWSKSVFILLITGLSTLFVGISNINGEYLELFILLISGGMAFYIIVVQFIILGYVGGIILYDMLLIKIEKKIGVIKFSMRYIQIKDLNDNNFKTKNPISQVTTTFLGSELQHLFLHNYFLVTIFNLALIITIIIIAFILYPSVNGGYILIIIGLIISYVLIIRSVSKQYLKSYIFRPLEKEIRVFKKSGKLISIDHEEQ